MTRLTIADLQEDKLETFKAEHANDDVEILAVVCNVADSASVKAMVEATVEKFGRLDYAVNCAGITGKPGRTADVTDEDWEKVIGVNQNGVFYCLREEIGAMLKQEPLGG